MVTTPRTVSVEKIPEGASFTDGKLTRTPLYTVAGVDLDQFTVNRL